MNITSLYGLAAGQKLTKPIIPEKFYPIGFDKYVTFQPYSRPSKNYDYWLLVLDIIHPYLEKQNIKIIQVGGKDEPTFRNCIPTQGTTNFGQLNYLIKHSLLHIGTDSIGNHMAGVAGTKVVSLFSNNFIEAVKPYWSDHSKNVYLEPDRTNRLPTFSLDETPKQINEIKPELIASSILKLLNIPFSPPYQSLFFGQSYNHQTIETVPNQKVHPGQFGADRMVIRLDYLFDEKMLAEQLSICDNILVSDKEINLSILEQFKSKIKQLIYIVKEDNNPNFIKSVIKLGISVALVSHLSEEELNKYKLNYIDLGIIHRKEVRSYKTIPELAGQSDLYFKTNRLILSAGKVYPSLYHLKHNIESSDNNQAFDDYDFWKDLELYFFYKKN